MICRPSGPSPTFSYISAWYKYYAYVRPENLASGWSRDRIVTELNAAGVPCMQGSCSEIYLEKAFEDTGMRPQTRLLVAREMGETSLMFLVHPTLDQEHIDHTCACLSETLERATGSQIQ